MNQIKSKEFIQIVMYISIACIVIIFFINTDITYLDNNEDLDKEFENMLERGPEKDQGYNILPSLELRLFTGLVVLLGWVAYKIYFRT